MTIHEAIGRAETELLTRTHADRALAYAALAIAKALAEINDRHEGERGLRMTQ